MALLLLTILYAAFQTKEGRTETDSSLSVTEEVVEVERPVSEPLDTISCGKKPASRVDAGGDTGSSSTGDAALDPRTNCTEPSLDSVQDELELGVLRSEPSALFMLGGMKAESGIVDAGHTFELLSSSCDRSCSSSITLCDSDFATVMIGSGPSSSSLR